MLGEPEILRCYNGLYLPLSTAERLLFLFHAAMQTCRHADMQACRHADMHGGGGIPGLCPELTKTKTLSGIQLRQQHNHFT